jgi:cell division protein FtsA
VARPTWRFSRRHGEHTAVSIGGNRITSDIAAGLRTPFSDAERIKQRYGCAAASDG